MRVLIIDDEPLARARIRECLAAHPHYTVCGECGDGFEALRFIQQENTDLLILDIQMPRINGFELLELLDQPPPVIFTTAWDQYALQAFDAGAVDYLLKPFSQERFDRALAKPALHLGKFLQTTAQTPEAANRIVVRDQGKIHILPLESIYSIEAFDDYMRIYAEAGTFLKKQTLTHYETLLAARDFVRVHRSALVRVAAITGIQALHAGAWEIRLTNGRHVQASRTGYQRLKARMGV
jgi:two-component system, LytTR family, response regulator